MVRVVALCRRPICWGHVYCLQSTGTTDMVIDVNGYFQ